MKSLGFIFFSQSRNPSFRHSHKPFNGFGHYDYICEIGPKNIMFFWPIGQNKPKKCPKCMKNEGPKYKKISKAHF
jgi:hypothetical protein